MKHIILIVLFTSALFSQDFLKLKNGKVYEGKYFGEQNGIIVFKIKGESSTLKFKLRAGTILYFPLFFTFIIIMYNNYT